MIAKGAAELVCEHNAYGVRLDDSVTIPARTVVIATGARYHRPSLANLGQFEGAGVYYNATFMEAQLCDGDEVIVVGGANSAGQAAVFLAQTVRHVHLLVRSSSLSASMSRYLIRRIEETPTIQIKTRTEIVTFEGTDTGVGWHTFRHTVGTMLAEMGEHQLTIREHLRHSNLHVTNKYLQATSKTKRLAHDKLVDAFLPAGFATWSIRFRQRGA
jgi:thioredoxin reductase